MRFLVVLLLSLSFGLSAQDFSLFEKKTYKASNGTELPYRLLLPADYDRTKSYPLVLFLHGAGERGNDNEKQLVHGAKLFLTDENRKNFPAIVVIPQCPTDSYLANVVIDRSVNPYKITFDYSKPATAPLTAVIELVNSIFKEEAVNKKRVYITGLSMGGMGTFEAVYRNPKLFAAAAPICGGGDTVRYNKKAAKVPFRIFHGDQDAVVGVNESRAMVAKLKSLKANVRYTEYPGVNHNSWDNAFAEPDFMSWLFSN